MATQLKHALPPGQHHTEMHSLRESTLQSPKNNTKRKNNYYKERNSNAWKRAE